LICASYCLDRCHSRFLLIPIVFLASLLTGCTGLFTGGSIAPTVAISASPTSIVDGTSSTLTITSKYASQVTVTGSDGSSYTVPGTGASQVVSPRTTTTYTASVSGNDGSASATATVTVTPAPPPTVTITANPAVMDAGKSSTLTVTATNATKVTLTGTDGSSYTVASAGGTEIVTPAATTTYTATASGFGGTTSATATVTVVPLPTVTISAAPNIIQGGSKITSTLTVTATNATGVTITGSDGSNYTLTATGGTQIVAPTATTTYTATATGPGGVVTATAVVTVQYPAPSVTITATPMTIEATKTATLKVIAVNSTAVHVTGTDGSTYILTASGGTQVVSPSQTTTYTATANGGGGAVATASVIVTVTPGPPPVVTLVASPTSILTGESSKLTVTAEYAATVTLTGSDSSSYPMTATGGTANVSPTATTTYTATATALSGTVTATAIVTVKTGGTVQSIDHVIFMLQENHSFDNYFGMLNPYRKAHGYNKGDDGNEYDVDGIDDKLTTISNQDDAGDTFKPFKFISTCIDDETSDWLSSYGDVNRYDFLTTRPIKMDGFVHTAEGYDVSCDVPKGTCSGTFSDPYGQRAMGYYDEGFLNYYYYMASQFAVSDRWFSPVSSKSIDNRIATFTGGTTQGLVRDPGGDDHLATQLAIPTIYNELDKASVSWKIYYTVTQTFCLGDDDCSGGSNAYYPATDFSNLTYSFKYLYMNTTGAACVAPTQPSSVVGDKKNSFCIDVNHIAPIAYYYTDLANGTLPQYAFIEPGYGNNDEHPGSGQSVLQGQVEVAKIVNAFMASSAWNDSVFFFSYDEGGGPYDHVPPVPGHSNDNTDSSLGTIPDISTIAVNADSYFPCPANGTPTLHCDLPPDQPGDTAGDAPQVNGFAAQLGFRLPNIIISPFTRKHYVSHIPMDHTAVIKFVESRFINGTTNLTARDAAQPSLLDFFDFNGIPWATPPTPPAPVTKESLKYNPCNAAKFAPSGPQ